MVRRRAPPYAVRYFPLPPSFDVEDQVVTLTTKHRSSIYRRLSRVIGEEEAEALLAEFPAQEHDELVTKQFLRAELAELRAEMNDRFRQQTIWMSGLMTTSLGVVAGIVALLG